MSDRDIEPDHKIDMTVWMRKRDFQRRNTWYICDEVIFPVCSRGYLSSRPAIGCIDDLIDHQLIHSSDAFRKRMSWPEWVKLAGGDPSWIVPNIVFNDYQLTLQAALAGEGIALGWSLTAQLLLKNNLLVRPLPDEIRTDRAFFLLASDRLSQNDKWKTLIDWFMLQVGELRT